MGDFDAFGVGAVDRAGLQNIMFISVSNAFRVGR